LKENSTKPVRVLSISTSGGGVASSRETFLRDQLSPILDNDKLTVSSLVKSIDEVYMNLMSFGVYEKVKFGLDAAPPSIFSTPNKLDLDATLHITKAKRFLARTGTDVGNGEGNGYANFTYKNIFGGAEKLSFDATIGTSSRSSYILNFTSPINNSPRWRGELIGYVTDRNIPWASHEQIVRGLTAKVASARQELGYEAVWRTISCTGDYSSATVRNHAGMDIKSSIYHSWAYDTRDSHLTPSRGFYFKTIQEIAGLGGHGTPFIKGSYESQYAFSFFRDILTLSAGTRGGLLWMVGNESSHLMDRFYLGGGNDVRGFRLSGIGPKDDDDYVGGDIYFASGISLLSKLPRLSPQNPLRLHTFVNGGTVLPVDQTKPLPFKDLLYGQSISAGFGLLYTHPIARFELNFTLPLVAREREGLRKGLQFGVGLSFL
jgi:outer membrane protein insertion porin family